MTKFCMELFFQAQAICSKPAGHQEVQELFWCRRRHGLQLYPVTVSSSSTFVGTSISIETRQPKLLCLELSSRLSFERVWETQGLPCIQSGVALNKTPCISEKKFTIRCLTLSILNLSSLMLTKLQKSPTSFDFFKKDSNPGSDRITQEGARQLGHISRRNDR